MRIFLLLIALTIIPLCSRSQTQDQTARSCGTEALHQHKMQTDAAYRTRFLQQKAIFDSIKVAPASSKLHLRSVVTIPVVVHVIHLGEHIGSQTNIPDDQIYGAIAGLNERYANVNGQGNDIEINFCLATRDPNGCPTSGINRVDGSVVPGYREGGITWDHECGVDEVFIKDLSKWPTWEYYNIWVVHDICGEIAGYAYYPNGNEYDGTVIDIASMRYDNGTLAHELGHGLNLRHTFSGTEEGNCPVDTNCLWDGDEVCDTPPHRTNDCQNSNPCSPDGVWQNSLNNWMSYCFPSAGEGLFTEGQRTRIWDAISVEPRSALLTSLGCSNEVPMKITSDNALMCPYDTRELSAQPVGGYFQITEGSGFIQNNILTPTSGPEIVVEYVIAMPSCTSSVYQEIPVRSVPQSLLKTGDDTLCIGQFTSLQGFPSGGTFSVVSGPGVIDSNYLRSDGAGIISLAYEKLFSGCVVRDSHEVMSFAFPVVSIESLNDHVLTAVPDSGTFQWLRCDQNYEPVADASGSILEVASSGSYAVVASNGSCRDTSDCLEVVLTATHDEHKNDAIRLYPNPVNDVFYLDGYAEDENVDMIFTDLRGVSIMPVFSKEGGRIKIDIAALPGGVYILQVSSNKTGNAVYRVVKL